VGHNGCAKHCGRKQHALSAGELWHQACGGGVDGRRRNEQAGQEPDRDNQQQAGDDALEHALASAVLDDQQHQRHDPGDHAADDQR
jgi:hypothetical protein